MITLYTSPTPNGHRASIMLEETGLPYRVRTVDLKTGEHKTPAFLAVNATGRIPAIVDDETDGAAPFALAETLAIAVYLAEKSGKLMPSSAHDRAIAMQWGATVISGLGPSTAGIYFARLLDEAAHGKIIAKFYADIDVYLTAMDERLQAHQYLAGSSFSFADALAIPTIVMSMKTFKVDLSSFQAIERWRDEVLERPAVAKGLTIS
jgi:glutathione S-transferase